MTSLYTRVNISIPKDLFIRLKKETPKGGFSRALVSAYKEKLDKESSINAFKNLVNAPSTFTEIKNPSKWIKRARSADEKRLKRLGL